MSNNVGRLSVDDVKDSIVMTGSIPAYSVCPFLGDCNGGGVRCPIDWSVLLDKPVSCGMARLLVM